MIRVMAQSSEGLEKSSNLESFPHIVEPTQTLLDDKYQAIRGHDMIDKTKTDARNQVINEKDEDEIEMVEEEEVSNSYHREDVVTVKYLPLNTVQAYEKNIRTVTKADGGPQHSSWVSQGISLLLKLMSTYTLWQASLNCSSSRLARVICWYRLRLRDRTIPSQPV